MKFILTIIGSCLFSMLAAQERDIDQRATAYNNIVETGTLEQKNALRQELLETAKKSKQLPELELSINYLYTLGSVELSDSLRKVVIKKYPKSQVARDNYMHNVFYKQEGAAAKEKSYLHVLKTWPPKNYDESMIAYDYAVANVAVGFAEEKNKDKALFYLGQLNEHFWRAQGYVHVAGILLNQGDTSTAISLLKTAIADAEYYINLPAEKKDNRAMFAATGYSDYLSQLVNIYLKQGKYQEALELTEKGLLLAPQQAARFSGAYYKGLRFSGRKLEALEQLALLYKGGDASYKNDLKGLYEELNGSDKGFDAYISQLDKALIKSIQEEILKHATYKDAPAFELLNLKGEKVNSADLKGKVVVLDFWATWCQPCVRSFPGMLAAQNHYESDNEVQFLFVNTWERNSNYKEEVAEFIKKNAYPFEVLFDDQKDLVDGKNLAAKFDVKGIPAKFVLDKNGKIRFALTGSNGSVDYTRLEMIELIEAAKKPNKL